MQMVELLDASEDFSIDAAWLQACKIPDNANPMP